MKLYRVQYNKKTAPISPYISSAYQKSQWHTADEIGMSADADRNVPTYFFCVFISFMRQFLAKNRHLEAKLVFLTLPTLMIITLETLLDI